MTDEMTLDLFEDGGKSFEDLARTNGASWWNADDLREALGYASEQSFTKVIQRAQKACLTLGIPIEENFRRDQVIDGSTTRQSYSLTRFACYLVSMNGDPKKIGVAKAQAFFASIAQAFQDTLADAENVERVVIRDELTEGQKSLTSAAKQAGVTNYPFFIDAGYRGMYNMRLSQLRDYKGIPAKATPFDYMGRRELAANLFRVTQTEEKIHRDKIKGQKPLERAAKSVGKRVRQAMIETGGTPPEELPAREPVQKVRSGLKKTNKAFKKLDKPKN